MVPATIVRELTVCVTFGAPHVSFFVASWRRPSFGHSPDMARGDKFGANATTNSCQSNCSWHTLPSRGAAQLRSQRCLRGWRFLVLPSRVLLFLARVLLVKFTSVSLRRVLPDDPKTCFFRTRLFIVPLMWYVTHTRCSLPSHLVY